MCYELIDRIIIGGHPKHTGKEREIDIVYKIDIASVLRDKLNKWKISVWVYLNSYAYFMPIVFSSLECP